MSDKEFFTQRYNQLGWTYRPVKLKQAIRINTCNIKKTDIIKRLKSKGIQLEEIPFLHNGYWITKAKFSVGATTEYLLGYYSIQEAAAQIPASLFTNLKGKIILDACAAPGGKTIQLANLMENTGTIIALDTKKPRLSALANQLERCYVENTIVYQKDARAVSNIGISFDRILLDLPCSGNFATDKDWFQKRKLKDVKRNAKLQRQILAEAVKVLKADGEIVYSTCSLEPEENEQNIHWAVKTLNLRTEKVDCYGENAPTNIFDRQLDPAIRNCRRIWPGQTQGFFVCKLKKREGEK